MSATFPPVLTNEQRQDALSRAYWVKAERAATKKRWRGLGITQAAEEFAQLLANGVPDWARNWKLEMALQALPTIGKVRAADALRSISKDVAANRRLGGLTPRQRLVVAQMVRGLAA